MAVVDFNERLLAMALKRLEVNRNDNEALKDYARYATEIFERNYEDLMAKITTADYSILPLEQQLTYLIEILTDYERLSALREEYNTTYLGYSSEPLILSDITNILIDNIKERISILEGYLISKKNIATNKEKISKLNIELIDETERESLMQTRLKELSKELIDNFKIAEGRIKNADESLKYTSVLTEYEIAGFDLETLLKDESLLQRLLDETNELLSSIEETLAASHVCYNNMPNTESKKNYDASLNDTLKLRYKLTMLQIAKLLVEEKNIAEIDYVTFKEIREKLKTLIAYRRDCLDRLGVKFLVDPFDKTKIDKQLEIINTLGNSDKIISAIKEKIQVLITTNEQMQEKNTNYYNQLTEYLPLYKDTTSMKDIIDAELTAQEEPIEQITPPEIAELQIGTDEVSPDKVVNISDIRRDFNIQNATAKAQSVIGRVTFMLDEQNRIPPVTDNIDSYIEERQLVKDEEIMPITHVFGKKKQASEMSDVVDFNTYENPFEGTLLFTNKIDDVFENANRKQELTPPVDYQVEFTEPDTVFATKEQMLKSQDSETSFWPSLTEDSEPSPAKTLKRVA